MFQWNKKWFFSRPVQFDSGFHVMTENKISWHTPKITLGSTIKPRWVLKWTRRRPVWFSLTIILFLSSVRAVPDWSGCSRILISSRKFDCSTCDWENVSPLIGVNTSFALCLLPWSSDASITSNSSMSASDMSAFQIPLRSELMQSR